MLDATDLRHLIQAKLAEGRLPWDRLNECGVGLDWDRSAPRATRRSPTRRWGSRA